MEISNLEDNLNGTNTYKAEPSISNQTDIIALMRYLFSAEKDSQPLPQPELLSGADFLLKSTLNQTKKFIETKIDSRQNLHTLWQKLFLPKDDSQSHAHGQLNSDASFILKSVSTQTQAMVEKVENTSQEEYKPFSGHPPITKETGREVTPKISSAAATAIDADETFTAVKHQTKDTLPEENLRQLLNIITGESKNKAAPEILKSDMDLKTAFFSNPELKEDGHILRSITTNNMDFNLQTSKENTQSISSAFSQIQLSSNAMEGLNETNAHLKQIAAAFEKNPQRVENSVLGQIAARLFTGVRQGMGNMTINLYPPELGKVKVKIVSEKGSLNVHLHSQNHYVVGVLEKYLSMLQHSLENHGIALSDLQVSVESENQEGSQFENQRFWFGDENVTSRQSLSEENQQPSLSENNPGWTRLPQGLSLRV
ncbi:MAG: flagellar hook-length control protein FliK [Desulfobacterales bacterium]